MDPVIRKAARLLASGSPVLIHDDSSREDEVDYVVHASSVTTDIVYEMRRLAGGLICYAMPEPAGRLLGLRYAHEMYMEDPGLRPLAGRRLRYGDLPAFSVWVNAADAYTGIRDTDRALTIRRLDEVTALIIAGRRSEALRRFREGFVAPGHVPILLGRRLGQRRGHTELSLHLAMLGGARPSTVVVEMLDRGGALSVAEARRVAERLGTVLVEGSVIVEEVERLGEDLYCRYNLCQG